MSSEISIEDFRAIYDLGRQHGAAQPTPAVKESSNPAPAGSLVERVMVLLGHHGDGTARTARAAIREVAIWLRKGGDFDANAWASLLEQEADR